MISKSRVDRAKFKVAKIAKVVGFFRNQLLLKSSSMRKSRSHVNHDLALSSFDYQIRENLKEKIVKDTSGELTVVDRSFLFGKACLSFLLVVGRSGFFSNPIHQLFVSIGNFDVGVVIQNWLRRKLRFGWVKSNEKATFSIDNSCKIGKFCISHKHPLLKIGQYTTNSYIFTA